MAPAANYYYSPEPTHKKRRLALKIIVGLLAFFVLAGVAYGAFFLIKIRALEKKINPTSEVTPSILDTVRTLIAKPELNLKGANAGRINILLLGVAGAGKPGQFLTDTIMLASVNTQTNQVALLSIPRDLYVKVPDSNWQTKINSVYQAGLNNQKDNSAAIEPLIKTIKNITSLDTDYYAVLNFDGFQKIIDALGGVNITNERDLFDASYPGPNYSYQTFELSKGFHHLDGAVALQYARERHNDPEGDFGRAKRQQQIIQATKNKIFSSSTLLNVVTLNGLFDALGSSIRTNIRPEEIGGFLELAKKVDLQNINNMVLDAWNTDSLLKVSHVAYASGQAFVLIPRVGNYSEIQDLAKNIFNLNVINRKKDAIAQESATLAVLNQSGNPALTAKIKKLLSDNLNYKNVLVLNSPSKNVQPKTVVYDLTNGAKPFTLDELVNKLPATPAYDSDPAIQSLVAKQNIDMVLYLGQDLEDIYNKEDGTLADLNNQRDAQDNLNLQNK